MALALIWIWALACSLLWMATGFAITGRIQRKWWRRAMLPIVVGPPGILLGLYVLVSVMLLVYGASPSHFAGIISLLIAAFIGTYLIAPRRLAGQSQLSSAHWPIAPLAFSLIIVVGLGYLGLWRLNVAAARKCEALDQQLWEEYAAALPTLNSSSQNAAPLYEQAFENLQKDDGDEVKNPPLGDDLKFDPNEPATLSYLKRQAGTIALLRRAAALPCRFEGDLNRPEPSRLGEIDKLLVPERNAAEMLQLDAREQIAHHHPALAIADANATLQLGRRITGRPTLINALVGIGIDQVGYDTLSLALPAVKQRNDLAGLRLAELPSIGRMVQQAMRGEERFGLALYEAPPKHWNENNPYDHSLIKAPPRHLIGRAVYLDLDQYTRLMAKLQALMVQPYFQVRDQLTSIKGPGRVTGVFAATLVQADDRIFAVVAQDEGTDACARAGVAMTYYRLDHGRLPDQLAELVPKYLSAIPIDPFNGRAVRLVVKKNVWVIYSVGENLIDNGGTWDVKQKGTDGVTFNLSATGTEAIFRP